MTAATGEKILVEAGIYEYDKNYRPAFVPTQKISISLDLLKRTNQVAIERSYQKGFSGFSVSPDGSAVFIRNGNGDFGTTVTLCQNQYSNNNLNGEGFLWFSMPVLNEC